MDAIESSAPAAPVARPTAAASPAGGPLATAALPIPSLQQRPKRLTSARYTLTRCNRHGRLASRHPLRVLGWCAGQALTILTDNGSPLIRAAPNGKEAITAEGFLLLPAAVRRRCGINHGEPLLVASYPDRNLIIICTPAVIDEMTLERFGFLNE
ncbi:hypothetical protein [Paractinoplanes toevensis]|uniref:SpoVT-AbrB domain-containing protein n=1 Tax=Paractinoplanes toevensis TaxID=571911 RepID=A0A919TFJ6_9ACTN|nr:hypothetical protein [Actinoplanes toevensis]GIM93194.1 hypothetical protein Ato02nite_049870 [Actinoplanes toevensis]